jgi:spore coat protein U-like protein
MLRSHSIQLLSLAATVALTLAGATAVAATDTSNMAVSATVTANCTISAGALGFGDYDPVVTHASADLDSSATLTITCTNGSAATITLGQGSSADTGSTDTVPLRRMTDGTDFLSYYLYQEAGRTTVWGNDASSDVDYTGTGSETTSTTVYGRASQAQNVPAGSYSDTVVATITF